MPTINYDYELPYTLDVNGRAYPRLLLQLTRDAPDAVQLDVDAYLDSGAERTVFQGQLAVALGLDLAGADQQTLVGAGGQALPVRVHSARLIHEDLGTFDLAVGFAEFPLRRNLLGRDYFALIQVGFREHLRTLYFSSAP